MKANHIRNLSRSAALLVVLSSGAVVRSTAQEPQGRNANLQVENVVQVQQDRVVVSQKQSFTKEFVNVLWGRLDENNDGKLSAEEKKGAEAKLTPYYTNYTGVRVNWLLVPPQSVALKSSNFPSRKPKDLEKASPIVLEFEATYAHESTLLDLVDLLIPQVNAHRIATRFVAGPGLRFLRANVGQMEGDGEVKEMLQVDGRPDGFSVMVGKRLN
jgi:hypothetical protein